MNEQHIGLTLDISKEICQALEYYVQFVESMGITGFAKEDAEKFVRDWLEVQIRLAWLKFPEGISKTPN